MKGLLIKWQEPAPYVVTNITNHKEGGFYYHDDAILRNSIMDFWFLHNECQDEFMDKPEIQAITIDIGHLPISSWFSELGINMELEEVEYSKVPQTATMRRRQ